MKCKTTFAILFFVMLVVFTFSTSKYLLAQSNMKSLIVEKEQHYETYLIGGTCIAATHNLLVTDLDKDGDVEIITGGYTYNFDNGTQTNASAQLKIWNRNEENLTLETSYKWPDMPNATASTSTVTAGDINQDGITELLTAGRMTNQTGNYAQLRIWTWNGSNLAMQATREWNNTKGTSSVTSAIINDVDKDGIPEILSAGRAENAENNQTDAQLRVWHWNSAEISPLTSTEWHDGLAACANSIAAADLNNDGETEIITAGYNHELKNSSGQICIWHYNNSQLSLQANIEWRTIENAYALNIAGGVQGNTVANNVKVGDIDKDGTPEIVTGGFTYDGEKVAAQLRVWNWTTQTISLEESNTWTGEAITEVKAIALNDVDADGITEIMTSGVTAGKNSFAENTTINELAQLKIWSWDGTSLTAEQSSDWTVGEGVCAWNVASGDVDSDGTVEIVTVGCMYVSNMCDPDLRIWSLAENSSPLPSAAAETLSDLRGQLVPVIVAGFAVAVIVVAAGYLFLRRLRTQKRERDK